MFSDELANVFLDFAENEKTAGLLLVDSPTGSGKSHAAVDAMAKYISKPNTHKRRVFFITPQKKNIPSNQKIYEALQREGYLYTAETVLRMPPIQEMVSENLTPERYESVPSFVRKDRHFNELFEAAERYRAAVKQRDADYIKAKKDDLYDIERVVRRVWGIRLGTRNYPEKQDTQGVSQLSRMQKLERLQTPEWNWLAKIYPTVFIDQAQILTMSFKKFLSPIASPLDSAETPFNMAIRDNSLVIIDEFDATKEDALSYFAEEAAKLRADMVDITRTIHSSLNEKEPPAALLKLADRSGGPNNPRSPRVLLEENRDVINQVFDNTNLKYEYRTEEGVTTSEFIFYDYHYNTTRGSRLYVNVDDIDHVNWITTKKNESSKSLTSLLSPMYGGNRHTQRTANIIANTYKKYVDTDTQRRAIKTAEEFPDMISYEQARALSPELSQSAALKTVLSYMGFHKKPEHMEYMMGGSPLIKKYTIPGNEQVMGTLVDSASVYERGFHFIHLIDRLEHNLSTELRTYALQNTPENLLAELCLSTKVIGLSATASLSGALNNYSLEYEKRKGVDVQQPTKEQSEALKKAYEEQTRGYENIAIEVAGISAISNDIDWGRILLDPEAQQRAIELTEYVEPFHRRRYARFVQAYIYFCKHTDMRAMLAIFMPKPSRYDDSAFSQKTLIALAKMAARDVGYETNDFELRFISESSTYQSEYESIKKELESGKRVFLVAAYKTVGTGVNLQYATPPGVETVLVNDMFDDGTKDFDAIYLDQPTALGPATNIDSISSLIKGMYDVCQLEEAGEISQREYKILIGVLPKLYLNPSKKGIGVSLANRPMVLKHGTYYIAQAVGRICRTNRKNKKIHILVDEEIINKADFSTLNGKLISRELAAVKKHFDNADDQEAMEPDFMFKNQAERKSKVSMSRINKRVRREEYDDSAWTETDMSIWREYRTDGLILECPTYNEGEQCRNLSWLIDSYAETPNPIKSYTYKTIDDYDNVEISFDPLNPLPQTVCEEDSLLPVFMANAELKAFFEANGWATSWHPGTFIMTPVVYNNMYKGALGEVIGKYIIESKSRGLRLEEITDGRKYEVMDNVFAGTDVYIDFKNWQVGTIKSKEELVEKYLRKLKKCEASRGIVCNVAGRLTDGYRAEYLAGGRILTIPLIYDIDSSSFVMEMIEAIENFVRDSNNET